MYPNYNMNIIPEDINSKWLAVIRRLQSVSKSKGLQAITISILVDQDGNPIAWTEPIAIKFEPISMASALLGLIKYNK